MLARHFSAGTRRAIVATAIGTWAAALVTTATFALIGA